MSYTSLNLGVHCYRSTRNHSRACLTGGGSCGGASGPFYEVAAYKIRVRNFFDLRKTYDINNDYHPRLASRLLQLANLREGCSLLDLAAGTGLVSLAAGALVGKKGHVLGVDLSPGMLAQAAVKQEALGLSNVSMKLGDVEELDLAEESFDTLTCCTAIPYITDIPGAFTRWRRWLKPGGHLVFNCFASPFLPDHQLFCDRLEQLSGIRVEEPNTRLGTREKCESVIYHCGFSHCQVVTESDVPYVIKAATKSEYAEKVWRMCLESVFFPLTGLLSEEQQGILHQEFVDLITSREDGNWLDGVGYRMMPTIHYVIATK